MTEAMGNDGEKGKGIGQARDGELERESWAVTRYGG